MDTNQEVEVQCALCGKDFMVLAVNYENITDENGLVTCVECQDKAIAEEQLPMKKFKYYIEDNDLSLDNINKIGSNGWELISINNNGAYFKKELLK